MGQGARLCAYPRISAHARTYPSRAGETDGQGTRGGACRNCKRQCVASRASDGAAQRKLPNLSGAAIAVGASWGCLSAWTSICFKSLNIYTSAGEATLDTVYLASIVTLCATLY